MNHSPLHSNQSWWMEASVVCLAGAVTLGAFSFTQAAESMPARSEPLSQAEQPVSQTSQTKLDQEVRYEYVLVHPSEGYLAGFAGYTFGGTFDAEGIGALNGANFGNHNLADSVVYGAKAGGFFPQSLSWLGIEGEIFNTTPHVEQQGTSPGSHMRVTTFALNAIARAQLGCTTLHDRTEAVTERFVIRYEREFCRLQPYAGVGLGIFWVNMSNAAFTAHQNFVPGLNVLGGIRYYFTERIAMFTEYKYNRATFDFSGPAGLSGFQGVYSVNHIVGGLSYHY
ncbi:hypothetical protein W02_02420 [Nitrospira sp. KM1]|uniref:outer membrane protein n=1 Tax=Nitrospira sp. KM1 TaxID=1936990 RepID=UPI0013A768BE|nr:hypothetical protein [Nitrospira sp. KM1]BCA53102.1 hypothetical protein W02_02420 [Nitrospira sp. KM1]